MGIEGKELGEGWQPAHKCKIEWKLPNYGMGLVGAPWRLHAPWEFSVHITPTNTAVQTDQRTHSCCLLFIVCCMFLQLVPN